MKVGGREEIIFATLKLASEKGLGAVSMDMIAKSLGIKKPSLYNHFKSKDELIDSMYDYLRERSLQNAKVPTENLGMLLEGRSACEVLQMLVDNYIKICSDENLKLFYKVVYSERSISPKVAKILNFETEKMISATKNIFLIMQNKKMLKFNNLEVVATSFALTVHGLMDYYLDKSFAETGNACIGSPQGISDYINFFCKDYGVGE